MGYVYAGQGENNQQFKIGRTSDEPKKRRAQHRTSNPQFTYYRTYKTTNPCAAENFLKKRFAEMRVPNTKEWFIIGPEEVDDGFLALDIYMQTHLSVDQEEVVESLKSHQSNGIFLKPDYDHHTIYQQCRKLKIQLDRLELDYQHWTDQIKLNIGCNDGIEGLFKWISHTHHGIDQNLLKSKYPEIWEECRKESFRRNFFLIDSAERGAIINREYQYPSSALLSRSRMRAVVDHRQLRGGQLRVALRGGEALVA